MTPRPFICTPSDWITDTTLNQLSDDAELLFRRLASATDRNWRYIIDPDEPEHTIRTLIFSPKRRFRSWNPDRVRRALHELLAAGMLTRHFHADRCWLQVGDRWKYVQGRDLFGLPEERQEVLRLSEELYVLDQPDLPLAHPDENEKKKKRRREPVHASPPSQQPERDEDQSERSESAFGACAGEAEIPGLDLHEVGTLMELVGLTEWFRNKEYWRRALRDHRRAIMEAIADFKVMGPKQQAAVKNRAAWLNKQFCHHKERQSRNVESLLPRTAACRD